MKLQLPENAGEPEAVDDASTAERLPAARSRFTVVITPRSMWIAAGIVLAVLVLVLLVTKALAALVLVFISIILAEAIRPLVTRLQRYRIPQPLAVILIYLCVIAILAGFLWVLLNPVVTQVSMLANQSPTYAAHLQQWSDEVTHNLSQNPATNNAVRQLSTALASWAQHVIPSLIGISVGLLTGVFALFINAVIVLTLSLFWLGMSTRFKRFVLELFPLDRRALVSHVVAKMSKSLGGWVLGTLIAMLLIGSLTFLGLFLLGIPYALLLGILAGFTELIPYLGPWISGSVAVVATLITTGQPTQALWVIVLFLIIQEVEGNVIEPLVMQRAVHIDPWLVLVSILIGGELLGLVGVILAVPVAAVSQVVTLEIVAPAIRMATNQRGAEQPV